MLVSDEIIQASGLSEQELLLEIVMRSHILEVKKKLLETEEKPESVTYLTKKLKMIWTILINF
jgi:hypothetical protein